MLRDELHEAVQALPIIDVHSHLRRDDMRARDLDGLLLYHMMMYPLRAAGMDEEQLWPGGRRSRPERAVEESLPFWQTVGDVSFGWALRTILRELYEFDEPLTGEALGRLRQAFDRATAREGWDEHVAARANLVRILSSQVDVPPLAEGRSDKGVRFTVESAPTTGTSEFVSWPQRLESLGRQADRQIASLADLREAVGDFYGRFDWSDKHALVAWVSSEADFRPVPDRVVDGLIRDARDGRDIGPAGVRRLEAALLRAVCEAIRGQTPIWQICYGTQFVTPGSAAHPITRAAPQFASSFAHLLGEFPDIHFNILSGCEVDEPVWCSLCLGYGNLSLAGYWWNLFYPSVMRSAWHRRLDMVPTSRLCGFFSDGWCIDWAYARVRMTQRVLAGVLAEKVEQGFYTTEQAVRVAREILFETPRRLFLPADEIAG